MKLALRLPLATLAATFLVAGATGCGSDLGDPVLRYADWDATAPDGDGGGTNSNNTLAEWLPDCGPGYYPCPPYGARVNKVMANFNITAANDAGRDFADENGTFSLADLHQSGAKLLFVFMTAGWWPYCAQEAVSLPGLQTEYDGDVIFLSIIREDGTPGREATVRYAETYADGKGFNFPAAADVGGNWGPFMGDGYPTNLLIDLRTMKLKYRVGGLMNATDIRNKLDPLL